jgi:hypothetical protein
MSRRSASPFATPETDLRSTPEIILGRYDARDLAARLAEAREHLAEAAPALRRDDRPAGRMTLLPTG